jgi:hypothetical protein
MREGCGAAPGYGGYCYGQWQHARIAGSLASGGVADGLVMAVIGMIKKALAK